MHCMQSITVYGIETVMATVERQTTIIACSLLPFTVLKPATGLRTNANTRDCMQSITVYGIETLHRSPRQSGLSYCMQPITVYGIETSSLSSLVLFS